MSAVRSRTASTALVGAAAYLVPSRSCRRRAMVARSELVDFRPFRLGLAVRFRPRCSCSAPRTAASWATSSAAGSRLLGPTGAHRRRARARRRRAPPHGRVGRRAPSPLAPAVRAARRRPPRARTAQPAPLRGRRSRSRPHAAALVDGARLPGRRRRPRAAAAPREPTEPLDETRRRSSTLDARDAAYDLPDRTCSEVAVERRSLGRGDARVGEALVQRSSTSASTRPSSARSPARASRATSCSSRPARRSRRSPRSRTTSATRSRRPRSASSRRSPASRPSASRSRT